MENKTKETTHWREGATSDQLAESKTKIALFADDRVKAANVRVRPEGWKCSCAVRRTPTSEDGCGRHRQAR